MNWLFALFGVLGGVAIGVQASINGGLGKKIGAIEGSLVSFAIGTVVLLLLFIFFGKGQILSVGSVPKWQLTGGLLGAFYIFISILIVPKIGVATSLITVIVGQVAMGTLIDHFGLFGGRQIPVDWQRVLAIVLLCAALYFFYRD
ncbi:DMT family transporter [Ammoniphilus resinae]|uniref:Transporter family-2 protein n=1 Tax=Ammoniphilus resinae TaxID=861532 RepID=A0ABS4GPJ9_9BACL|nr:DMT family transporter [Ammoniphilus resinae]MBP1932190.1 transporter family-2 protein [Ammoniphilus resinae]